MNPNAPQPNPYDFLNSAGPQPKKSFFTGGGPKDKKLVSALFILGVIIVLIILFNVYKALTGKDYGVYVTLAAKQTELIRITDLGTTNARTSSVKNYVSTIRATTASEKAQTLAFLKKKQQKVTDKQLVIKKNTSTDKTLTAAQQTSTYDETLISSVNTLVLDYQKSLSDLPTAGMSKNEKTLVTQLKADAKVIANSTAK